MAGSSQQGKKSVSLRIGEYIAGTTVEEFARWKYRNAPKEKSSTRRDVIKLEITTDDEAEKDTLRLTYPRSGRHVSSGRRRTQAALAPTPAPAVESESESESASTSEPETVLKKVRFETITKPHKSALKKKGKTSKAGSSDDDASSESDTSSKVYGSSEDSSSEGSAKARKKEKKKKKNSKPSTPEDSSDDTDADDKVECNCPKCVKRRIKQKKKAEDSNSEASQSEAEIPPKAKRSKHPGQGVQLKKGRKRTQNAESDSEVEPTSSAADTETDTAPETGTGTESDTEPQAVAKEVKATREKGAKSNKQQNKSDKRTNAGAGKQAKGEKGKGENTRDKKKEEKQERLGAASKNNYLEAAIPSPHARRPHFTEPIRAEVVQMERVVEGPKDPYPNAYYDAEHGIMRVYQGPVYGSRGSQPLYPKRDPNLKPLPIGVPHPSQNPYYYGFREQEASRVPYNQGAPMDAYHPAYAPLGYPPPVPGYGPPGPPYQAVDYGAAPDHRRKKPSYAMSGANGKAPSSKRDAAGVDNVGPPGPKLGLNNPYYETGKSRFSSYGSHRSASGQSRKAGTVRHHSPARSHNTWGWAGSHHYPQPGSPTRDNWAAGSKQGSQQGGGGWNDPPADKPPGNSGWDAMDQNIGQNPSGQASAWDATANSNNGYTGQAPEPTGSSSWDNNANNWGQTENNNDTGGETWGQAPATDNNGGQGYGTSQSPRPSPAQGVTSPQCDNVGPAMPSSWMPDTQYTSSWGDNTMAASTGGAVDQPGGDWDSRPPDSGW